jgi:hypothetical protein
MKTEETKKKMIVAMKSNRNIIMCVILLYSDNENEKWRNYEEKY